jgi:hypothetical protein
MPKTHRAPHRFHAVTIAAVRYGNPTLALLLLVGPGCREEPGVPRSEIDGLLQRLDAMDRRLDVLEDALAQDSAAAERPPSPDDERASPLHAVAAVADAEPPHTLAVRLTTSGIEIDGHTVPRERVLDLFRDVALIQPGTRLTVLTEPGVPYAAVVDAMDLARQAGLTDIAMSARIHDEGEVPAGP